METNVLQEKLASLPEEIQRQVADYIDFLIERYHQEGQPLTDTPDNARWSSVIRGIGTILPRLRI